MEVATYRLYSKDPDAPIDHIEATLTSDAPRGILLTGSKFTLNKAPGASHYIDLHLVVSEADAAALQRALPEAALATTADKYETDVNYRGRIDSTPLVQSFLRRVVRAALKNPVR